MTADFQREKNILRQLVQAQDAIRRKYRLLKFDKENTVKALRETLKPIVEPLEEIVIETKKKKNRPPKVLALAEKHNKPIEDSTDDDTEVDFETAASEDEDDTLKDASIIEKDADPLNAAIIDDNGDEYLRLFNKKKTDTLDKVYGVYKDDNIYKIGNSSIYFDKDKLKVDEVVFPRTKGLMELLIIKRPDTEHVTQIDMQNYKKILEISNAHRRQYDKNEAIRTHNSNKFNQIIAPLFDLVRTSKSGTGMALPRYKVARRNTNRMDYIYWDDPNELVERLRLLMAERLAGNQSHTNEIHSIIEELREGSYIY